MEVTKMPKAEDLVQINEYLFEIPRSFSDKMAVPARIYITRDMVPKLLEDKALVQLINMTSLPGIQQYALAMPDIHQGYGFPIGGIAATDIAQGGIISPGGIGYDINCGVRLLASDKVYDGIKEYIAPLARSLHQAVPSGMGKGGPLILSDDLMDAILQEGAPLLVNKGYGLEEDLIFCEERGAMAGANSELVSSIAKQRGKDQLGTLGSGNHFLEIQVVDEVYDEDVARLFGLELAHVTIMIHCGSRGLGHQVCTDYMQRMVAALPSFGYTLPDINLACAPYNSREGSDYFAAMVAAANFAWANRHMISHAVRTVWKNLIGNGSALRLVYDVSHNIGKRESYMINGCQTELMLHRKGATRAFGPNNPELPFLYKGVGQPVLIPGTMGTASYILVGTKEGASQAFSSSCHGAGRQMSRTTARKMIKGAELRRNLRQQGIMVYCNSDEELAEEAPASYKDIDQIVAVMHGSSLARKVARVRPVAVIKG